MENDVQYFDEDSLPVVQDEGPPASPMDLAKDWGLDVEQQTLLLEKAVKYGPRLVQARNTLLRMFCYAQDWAIFGEGDKAKACLSAAGVLRIVDKANFPIRYHDVRSRKEIIRDKDSSEIGYRFVFEGYATLNSRTVFAIGQYSTRDAFLGKKGGEWRDASEINESHIRQAAHTMFKGNGAKDLLGLKNIPLSEYEQITSAAGQDAARSTSVRHNTGGQGGISNSDRDKQNELKSKLDELAALGLVVHHETGDTDKKDYYTITPPSEELLAYIQKTNADTRETYIKSSLKALTTWTNSGGKLIAGHADFAKLKDKQLSVLVRKVEELIKEEGL